jgi:hypothetical protein
VDLTVVSGYSTQRKTEEVVLPFEMVPLSISTHSKWLRVDPGPKTKLDNESKFNMLTCSVDVELLLIFGFVTLAWSTKVWSDPWSIVALTEEIDVFARPEQYTTYEPEAVTVPEVTGVPPVVGFKAVQLRVTVELALL